MSKGKESKAVVVSEIQKAWESSQSVILVDYRGLTVSEDTELRRQMREAGVQYQVLKNTLITRATESMGIEGLENVLKGPTAVAFGLNDAVAPAKVLSDFIKKTKKMEIKCGVLEGKMISAANVQALADLPSIDVLRAKMLGSLNAPITGFVTVLGGTIRSLLYTLNAIKDKKAA